MSRKPPPTKTQIVKMQALHELGNSNRQIGLALGISGHTVAKYIKKELSPGDRERVKELVEKIRATELEDLAIIGAKARARLHEVLDGGNVKPIEATAIMDRAFQQRRLLEGESNMNIALSTVVKLKHKLEQLKKEG